MNFDVNSRVFHVNSRQKRQNYFWRSSYHHDLASKFFDNFDYHDEIIKKTFLTSSVKKVSKYHEFTITLLWRQKRMFYVNSRLWRQWRLLDVNIFNVKDVNSREICVNSHLWRKFTSNYIAVSDTIYYNCNTLHRVNEPFRYFPMLNNLALLFFYLH